MKIYELGMTMHLHNVDDIVVEEMDGANGATWRRVRFLAEGDTVLDVASFPKGRGDVVWLTVKGEPKLRLPDRADPLNDTLRDIALLQRQAD